jgi:hypothetical protein
MTKGQRKEQVYLNQPEKNKTKQKNNKIIVISTYHHKNSKYKLF